MNLVITVWNEDSTRVANESVSARVARLHNQIKLVKGTTSPTFMVFVAAEFLFMHGHANSEGMRWYTKDERNEALAGLAAASRLFGRLLVVGGSICWAKSVSHFVGKKEWLVRNEAPVHYAGSLLSLYGKRFAGGEIYAEDALRLYRLRRGALNDDMYVPNGVDATGARLYNVVQATGNLGTLAALANNQVRRGPGGIPMLAAPGLKRAKERYETRMRFVPGADEPSFAVPGGNFTAGIEICQEHNLGALIGNSSRGATNFHLLTSNTVGHQAARENLRSPGYFIHAKAGSPPELVTLNGPNRTVVPAGNWTQMHADLHCIEVPMPVGL